MSVSGATDPIATVIDVLNNATAGDWTNPNGAPTRIERHQNTKQSDKMAYENGDALYAYSIGPTNIDALDGSSDKYVEAGNVGIEIWTLDGVDVAAAIGGDTRRIINDFWTDNHTATEWTTVRVTEENDRRPESWADHGQHDRYLVTARLMRRAPV